MVSPPGHATPIVITGGSGTPGALPYLALAERGDVFRPGDVIMHNDPYGGASHGPDVGFCVPVFDGADLIGRRRIGEGAARAPAVAGAVDQHHAVALREGAVADLVVFDAARVDRGPVESRSDLPGGAA